MAVVQVVTETVNVTDSLDETLTVGVASVHTGPSNLTPIPAGFTSPGIYSFTNGTSTTGTVAGVIDLHFENSYVIASSGSTTLTLSALTDTLGRTVNFARVRKMLIVVTSKTLSSNDSLTIGAAALHAWVAWLGGTTPTVTVRDALLLVDNSPAGLPVVAATTDQLKIANAGSNSMTVYVAIDGCST